MYKEGKVFQFYCAVALLSLVYAFALGYSDKILIIWLHLVKKKGDCMGEKGTEGHKGSEM